MSTFTYNFSQNLQLSQVRMLIADTNISKPVFDDDEVMNALQLTSSQGIFTSGQAVSFGVSYPQPVPLIYSVYRAAALLLDCIAANKSKLASITELLDVKLSPDKAATALRAQAAEYRNLASNDGSFAIAEITYDEFSARERIYKMILRLYGSS